MKVTKKSTAPMHPAELSILTRVAEHVKDRCASIKMMIFDVDGILTDGTLYYNEHGETFKKFNVLDNYGLRLLIENGLIVNIITGRSSSILSRHIAELGISEPIQGVKDKKAIVLELSKHFNVQFEYIGYMGDDLIDLPIMKRVRFAASVSSAPIYVSQMAHWISKYPGGHGAVRECCDLLLASKGLLSGILSERDPLTNADSNII